MTDTRTHDLSVNQHTDNRTDNCTDGHTAHTDNSAANDPARTYTIEDDIRDILSALIDILRWIASFSLTDFICRLLGRSFDPEGSKLPEWNFDAPKAEAFRILHDEHIQPEGDGYAIYDKVVYGNAKVTNREEWENERLTLEEVIALQQYKPALLNTSLAKQVKYYLKKGSKDRQIAVLSGYAEKTIQHYRLALERASA